MANAVLLLVGGFGVGDGEGLHDGFDKVIRFCVDQEVVVVGHKAVGDDGGPFGSEILAEAAQEEGPVFGEE